MSPAALKAAIVRHLGGGSACQAARGRGAREAPCHKEAKRQAQLQEKYAKKKQSDPLLAARLALAGLQPPEAVPKLKPEYASRQVSTDLVPVSRPSMSGAGLTVPGMTSPSGRKGSFTGSINSFHTALDVPVSESTNDSKTTESRPVEANGDASSISKGSRAARSDRTRRTASLLHSLSTLSSPSHRKGSKNSCLKTGPSSAAQDYKNHLHSNNGENVATTYLLLEAASARLLAIRLCVIAPTAATTRSEALNSPPCSCRSQGRRRSWLRQSRRSTPCCNP